MTLVVLHLLWVGGLLENHQNSIQTADEKLDARYERCGKRGASYAKRATFDAVSKLPSEKAFGSGPTPLL